MYTEAEIRFLMNAQPIETADRSTRPLRELVDLRTLGCPTALFDKVLETRAKQLGGKFTEFRNSQRPLGGAPEMMSLKDQLEASKLF